MKTAAAIHHWYTDTPFITISFRFLKLLSGYLMTEPFSYLCRNNYYTPYNMSHD